VWSQFKIAAKTAVFEQKSCGISGLKFVCKNMMLLRFTRKAYFYISQLFIPQSISLLQIIPTAFGCIGEDPDRRKIEI
jgi:hypothetical protein